MADESQEPLLISTKRPSSTGESGTLQKLTLVPQSGWPLPRVAPRASPWTKAIRRAYLRPGHRAPGRGGRRSLTVSGCL